MPKRRQFRRLGTFLVASTLLAMVSSCSGDGDYQPSDRVGELSFRWTAPPEADLTRGVGVALRAYLESYDRALFAQDENAAYQGFSRAAPANTGDPTSPTGSRHPYTSFVVQTRVPETMGTGYYDVLQLRQHDGGYEAIVCSDIRRMSHKVVESWGNPRYRAVSSIGGVVPLYGGQDHGLPVRTAVTVMRVMLRGTPDPDLTQQAGPSRYPHGDVFGDWVVEQFAFYSGTSTTSGSLTAIAPGEAQATQNLPWPTARTDLRECYRRALPVDELDASDQPLFPTEPPIPGWPQ